MSTLKFKVSFEVRKATDNHLGKYIHVTKYENENKTDPILNGEVLSYQSSNQANIYWLNMMMQMSKEEVNVASSIKGDIVQKMHDAGIESGNETKELELIAQIESITHENLELVIE